MNDNEIRVSSLGSRWDARAQSADCCTMYIFLFSCRSFYIHIDTLSIWIYISRSAPRIFCEICLRTLTEKRKRNNPSRSLYLSDSDIYPHRKTGFSRRKCKPKFVFDHSISRHENLSKPTLSEACHVWTWRANKDQDKWRSRGTKLYPPIRKGERQNNMLHHATYGHSCKKRSSRALSSTSALACT